MSESGFTLTELMVVVAMISILSAIGIPAFTEHKDKALVAATASDLRNFATLFESYFTDNEAYPEDVDHGVIPTGMETSLSKMRFDEPTRLGGNYNWEGPDYYSYAGISLTNSTADIESIRHLDSMLDDGDLSTGRFRVTPNGRYTYIIQE